MDNDRSQIEEIKEKIDIVNLISKYVEIHPAGKNFVGLCPFHNEKTPSFIVSPDIQRYKCFGCGETGDIFNFIMKVENLDFSETLEKLAKEAGIVLKKRKVNPNIEKLQTLNKKATEYYYRELRKKENKHALKYLKDERKFSEDTLKTFALGYAPGKGDLLSFLKKSGTFTKKNFLDSGLFTEKNGVLKEKFFKRIMFPIRNSQGKFIGFSGRVLPGDDFGPKYMNTPETILFHKKDNLFGFYESRQEIRKKDFVTLCEGQTDVISAHQNGMKNITAPLGTALTKEQLEKLSHLTKNILFFFDSDEAGKKATIRGFKLASKLNLHPYATNSAPYKDLDEMIKKDCKTLKQRISNKTDAFSYLLFEFVENTDLTNYGEHNKAVSFINNLLASVTDKSSFDFYKSKAEKIVGLLDQTITDVTNTKVVSKEKISKKVSHEKDLLEKESLYLQLLLLKDNIELPKDIDIQLFSSKEVRNVLEYIHKHPGETRQDIFTNTDSSIVENLIFSSSKIMASSQEGIEEDMEFLYTTIQKNFSERKLKNLNVKIAIAEEKGQLKQSKTLLEEYQSLLKEIKKYD